MWVWPKIMANAWGLLLIILILGYSLVDVLKRLRRKMSPERELGYYYVKLSGQKYKLEELEYSLEYKIEILKEQMEHISDSYTRKKFEYLIANLPFERKDLCDVEDYKRDFMGDGMTLESVESEIH